MRWVLLLVVLVCCCWLLLLLFVVCCCNCRWESVPSVCVVVGRCVWCVVIICGTSLLLFVVIEFDCWCVA